LDDLVRRDFTVNAMAVRITSAGAGEFVDPLGSLAALRAGALDTPATPSQSFGDDPLRMLRAARFVSQLASRSLPRVRSAIEEMAPELARITAERVAAELDKLPWATHSRRGHRADGADRDGRRGASRGPAACKWRSTSTTSTKTSTSIH
jgi:tRNA nucleotidyltransferase/poly(A) polymerase